MGCGAKSIPLLQLLLLLLLLLPATATATAPAGLPGRRLVLPVLALEDLRRMFDPLSPPSHSSLLLRLIAIRLGFILFLRLGL